MAEKKATLLLQIKEFGSDLLDRFVITLGDVIDIASKIPDFVGQAISAFKEQESAVNSLNQSMINQGVFSGELQRKYLDLSSALQSTTTFTDDQINSAQALLQSHVGNREVTESLLKATLDLATAKKMDLSSAADLVGKAIASENDVLSRHGIKLDETKASHDRLGAVVDAVSTKFGGQAEAARQGLGAIDGLKNSWGEFMEVVGERLAPMVTQVAKFADEWLRFYTEIGSKNSLAKQSSQELGAKFEELATKARAIRQEMSQPIGKDGFVQAKLQVELNETLKQMESLRVARDQARRAEEESDNNAAAAEKERRATRHEERMQTEMDNQLALDQQELAMIGASEEQKLQAQISFNQKRLAEEKSVLSKLAIQKEIHNLNERLKTEKHQKTIKDFVEKSDKEEIANRASTLQTIATLQNSSNRHLAVIGKAAALTQIAIATPEAVAKAYTLGPIAGPIAAAAVYAAMAAQAAQVMGVQLAEGGIVMPRAGGIQATIGEGGQAEAVIPLDRASEFGFGGGGTTITINAYGGILGNQDEAREFAIVLDRELFKLRKSNESVSFDSGIV